MTDTSRRNVNFTEGALDLLDALNRHFGAQIGRAKLSSSYTVSNALVRLAVAELGQEETDRILGGKAVW